MSSSVTSGIRALIVDDEPLARQGIRMMLKNDPDITEVEEARNGRQALRAILDGKPDLVFLDVQMPEMDGFEVLRKAGVANVPAVVFVTAYDQYAIEAFEVQAVDYLLKPFTAQRMRKALERSKSRLRGEVSPLDSKVLAVLEQIAHGPGYLTRLAVKSGGATIFLEIESVDWIAAAENYVELHAGKMCHLVQVTMNKLVKRLDPAIFLRIHRSFIVNLKRVRKVQSAFHGEYVLTLHNGVQLRSGRTYHESVRRLLSNIF
jgi:two-component system, LytTR family, response regulator